MTLIRYIKALPKVSYSGDLLTSGGMYGMLGTVWLILSADDFWSVLWERK